MLCLNWAASEHSGHDHKQLSWSWGNSWRNSSLYKPLLRRKLDNRDFWKFPRFQISEEQQNHPSSVASYTAGQHKPLYTKTQNAAVPPWALWAFGHLCRI